MFIMRAALATVLLTAFPLHTASAQSKSAPLTNGDVIRLVMMRISDQTVIAVINEARTKQFDLTPTNDSPMAGTLRAKRRPGD
jgi:hypothetical protein